MNRTLKFRAWDKRFKGMDFGAGGLLLRINEKDFSEPMQFTGLLDKNGKEIYEGDMLKVGNGKPFEVVWWGSKCSYNIDSYAKEYGCEIIGNIYENPELLK